MDMFSQLAPQKVESCRFWKPLISSCCLSIIHGVLPPLSCSSRLCAEEPPQEKLPEKSPEKPCVPPNPRDSITPSTPTFLSSPSVCPSFMSSQEALPSCLPKRPFLHVFPRGLQSTQLVWCPLTHGPPQTPHYQTQNLMISGLRVNWKAQPSQNHQRTPKSRVSGCPICPVGKGNAVKCKE